MKSYIALCSTVALLLAGCSKWTGTAAAPSNSGVAVSVHGVNYTADPFTYVVEDARDSSNKAGGEHIGPFGGGGIMCCYTLPKKWTPGITIKIHSTHWLPKDAAGNLPEVNKEYTLEVPEYPNGKAEELWVLRTADGGIELVASDVEPGHPQWPGKVKGWPEPSLAYQRERWELHRKHAESSRKNYESLLSKLNSAPAERARDAWNFALEYRKDEIARYRGPDDPAYIDYLRNRYREGLKGAEEDIEQLMKDKP